MNKTTEALKYDILVLKIAARFLHKAVSAKERCDYWIVKELIAKKEMQLAEPVKQEPVAIVDEWKPCMKLPIVVHVREQREGETHVSTREGITPILPTDLIMRGVDGEEYPIGYELFNKTYTFEIAAPVDAKAIRAEALKEAEEIAKTIGGSFADEFLAATRELK